MNWVLYTSLFCCDWIIINFASSISCINTWRSFTSGTFRLLTLVLLGFENKLRPYLITIQFSCWVSGERYMPFMLLVTNHKCKLRATFVWRRYRDDFQRYSQGHGWLNNLRHHDAIFLCEHVKFAKLYQRTIAWSGPSLSEKAKLTLHLLLNWSKSSKSHHPYKLRRTLSLWCSMPKFKFIWSFVLMKKILFLFYIYILICTSQRIWSCNLDHLYKLWSFRCI